MRLAQTEMSFETQGRGFLEVTSTVAQWVADQAMDCGLLTLFCRHTSASLTIQENADPDVLCDLESFLARLAPEDPGRYRHGAEGPDDMPAHIRTALTGVSLQIPLAAGRLGLGTWQGIFLIEHRRSARRRRLLLHLAGE